MRKTTLIVIAILLAVVLGCTLTNPIAEKQGEQPKNVEQKDDSEETAKLKDKIAELEKGKLEEKIDDLEKKIDQQGKAPATSTAKSSSKGTPVPAGFGRVNSPNDGFLALRTEPSVDRGSRLAAIPHGKTIRVYNCGGRTTVGGRTGRWCRVEYRENVGWVFDAFLIR